jgi:hypothetical protein
MTSEDFIFREWVYDQDPSSRESAAEIFQTINFWR